MTTESEFERTLTARLRAAADAAPRPPAGVSHVERRVDERRRRRSAIRVGVGGATFTLVAGLIGVRMVANRGTSIIAAQDSLQRASGGSLASPVSSLVPIDPAGQTQPAAGWPRYIGPTADGWSLKTATSWNQIRTVADAWPILFTRTSTWSSGTHSPTGPFVVIHTDVAPPPADAVAQQTGDRTVQVRIIGPDALDVWFTEDVGGKVWTTMMRGRKVNKSAVLDMAAGAAWNPTDQLWDLPTAPTGWSRERWPDTGSPREILLSFERTDGAKLDVLLAHSSARLGAVATRLADSGTLEPFAVRGHNGAVVTKGDSVTLLWAEADMIVGEARATGLSAEELVELLGDLPSAAIEARLQRL
jgi:hypothetical protein